MDRYGVPATARASLACFSIREDLDALARGVRRARELFK
jgi:cysteine desulfurase/selenocysteine lyase